MRRVAVWHIGAPGHHCRDPAWVTGQVEHECQLPCSGRNPAHQQGQRPILIARLGEPPVADIGMLEVAQPAPEHHRFRCEQVQCLLQAAATAGPAAGRFELGESDQDQVIPAGELGGRQLRGRGREDPVNQAGRPFRCRHPQVLGVEQQVRAIRVDSCGEQAGHQVADFGGHERERRRLVGQRQLPGHPLPSARHRERVRRRVDGRVGEKDLHPRWHQPDSGQVGKLPA